MSLRATENTESDGLRLFNAWLGDIPVSRTTGWRWVEAGWIQVINIAGRPYVRQSAIKRFIERSEAGEFKDKSPLSVRKLPVVAAS